VESGVWLVSPDGVAKRFLGIGTGSPVWSDEDRIVFTATIDGKARL
jgi:hypothetical protein